MEFKSPEDPDEKVAGKGQIAKWIDESSQPTKNWKLVSSSYSVNAQTASKSPKRQDSSS